MNNLDNLAWNKQDGLLPAIVQDADTLCVLMLGYMDRTALQTTLDTGRVTFYSRSRGTQWTKGETSGHFLELARLEADCDNDTLLVQARPKGPTCHRGTESCFPDAPGSALGRLDALVARRHQEMPPGSYTTSLFEGGMPRMAQKVGEEGVETALAAVTGDDAELVGEAADLVYHVLVLLRARGLSLEDVSKVLAARAK